MAVQEALRRLGEAGSEFNEREERADGTTIAASLNAGLGLLRNVFYRRIHDDVEQFNGLDSLVMPLAPSKAETATKLEIDIYLAAVASSEARSRGYVRQTDWFDSWLLGLRLGETARSLGVLKRWQQYLDQTPEDRRLAFSNVLERALPESSQAPLVLHRLLPLSAAMAAPLAFHDPFHAAHLRNQQIAILPAISDCPDCHGRPLENGESCSFCGNPLWKFNWLNSTE